MDGSAPETAALVCVLSAGLIKPGVSGFPGMTQPSWPYQPESPCPGLGGGVAILSQMSSGTAEAARSSVRVTQPEQTWTGCSRKQGSVRHPVLGWSELCLVTAPPLPPPALTARWRRKDPAFGFEVAQTWA